MRFNKLESIVVEKLPQLAVADSMEVSDLHKEIVCLTREAATQSLSFGRELDSYIMVDLDSSTWVQYLRHHTQILFDAAPEAKKSKLYVGGASFVTVNADGRVLSAGTDQRAPAGSSARAVEHVAGALYVQRSLQVAVDSTEGYDLLLSHYRELPAALAPKFGAKVPAGAATLYDEAGEPVAYTGVDGCELSPEVCKYIHLRSAIDPTWQDLYESMRAVDSAAPGLARIIVARVINQAATASSLEAKQMPRVSPEDIVGPGYPLQGIYLG